MKKMKYHDDPPVKPQPEIVIKEVIREVIKEVPVHQPPQIITKEVVKEVQSPRLIEEINRLTEQLAKKDEIIHQMNFEKSLLLSEVNGLKEDKADLRADKARLHEEIALLRKSELINQEQFLQKTLELEQLSKMFNEFSVANNSFIQEEKQESIIVINNSELVESKLLAESSFSILENDDN